MTDKKTNNGTPAEQEQKPQAVKETAAKDAAAGKAEKSSAKAAAPKAEQAETPKKATPAAQAAPAAEKSSGSKTGAIAIALVIALGAGLYYHGHQQSLKQEAQISALKEQISSLQASQSEQANLASSQQQNLSRVSQDIQRTGVELDQQGKSITGLQLALSEIKGRRPNDWLLAEADHLIKMAGRKLWLEHDVITATLLVETADQRIAELNDPSLTPVRQALATDITTLKSVARIDRDGLVLRLTSLQQQIDKLPLANAIMPAAEETTAKPVSGSIDDWKENLKSSLLNFSEHFVTYRKRDGNVIPLLSPKQDFYLQEYIKSKLETAIKSVYREQGELYAASLSMAKEWAEQFYDLDDPATQSFIQTLEQLAQQRVEVSYPDTLNSQALISDLIDDRLRTQITTTLSTEENPA